MFKSLTSAAAIALALSVGSAFAADLPSHKAPPYIPPPPPPLWTGFYVGLNAGYTWSGSNTINTASANLFGNPGLGNGPVYGVASAALATFVLPASTDGFIGGGQIGYNWQFANSFVAGVEADIQGVAGSNGVSSATSAAKVAGGPAEFLIQSASSSRKLDYLGTVRGRLGFLVTPTLLVYGTGGLAYGGVSARTSIGQFITAAPGVPNPYFSAGAFSDTRVGWTAGGGGEWMFMPNWSAKVEYLYYDLGRVTYSSGVLANFNAGGVLFTVAAPVSTTNYRGHIVRAGLNYHFNWGAPPAVYAKY